MRRHHAPRIRRGPDGRLTAAGRPAVRLASGLKQWWLDGKLHRPDGPAVETDSGTRWHYWRGVKVPRQLIESPRSLSPAEILKISNAEIRRCWCEAYGLEDVLIDLARDGHARIIHQETEPSRRLWEIQGITDVDENHPRYVEVHCSSTGKTFFLRVPPNVKTCHAAVAWTFAMNQKKYVPNSET